jgi:hypothetical protein
MGFQDFHAPRNMILIARNVGFSARPIPISPAALFHKLLELLSIEAGLLLLR